MTDILTHFTLSPPQEKAVTARSKDVVVTAGAGTGKTRTLVARFLSLLADGLPLRQIVAITFTRKAAREMRNRVRADIGRYLAQPDLNAAEYERWQRYQYELDAARIGTIHNLCGEILRNHPAEAGIDPRFNVLDEVQSALLLRESVEAAMAWAVQAAGGSGKVGDNFRQLFEILSEQQVRRLIGAMLYERPTMVTLGDNLAPEKIYDHWQEQLAAGQNAALKRLTADPDWLASVATLKRAEPVNPHDSRVQQQQMVLAAIAEAEGESTAGQRRALSILREIDLRGGSVKAWANGKEEADAVKGALSTLRELWKNETVLALDLNSQDEAAAAVMPAIFALFDYSHHHYQAAKEAREALDFDDLEGLAVDLLHQHSAVREYWQTQIGAMLVDEFQDTNERQRHFIRLLCPEPGKLFIVGDAKQSIYRFRGADVTVFQTERALIYSGGGEAINLDTSYRAHKALLESMNHLLEPVMGDGSIERPSYVAPFDPLYPADKAITEGVVAPFVEFHLALGNKGEALSKAAEGLAARLIDLYQNSSLEYGQMAILCRTSNAFQYYEDALDKAGIPYLTVAGKGFYDRPEIRDLLNMLQTSADPHDDLALVGFLRSPGCGLSDESLYYLAQARPSDRSLWEIIEKGVQLPDIQEQKRLVWGAELLTRLNNFAGRIQVADLLKLFLDETNYLAALRLAGQTRALRNVAKLLADIHNSALINVSDFLEYARSLKDSGSREGEARSTISGAVQIMSIHQAKGLEFPVVVLGDAAYNTSARSQGIIIDPLLGVLLGQESDDGQKSAAYELGLTLNRDQDAAELNRLLYVALTRAEQILMISGHGRLTRKGLSLAGWLGQLGEITGLYSCSLADFDEDGGGVLPFDLAWAESAVKVTFYEPKFTANDINVEHVSGEIDKPVLSESTLNRVGQKLNAQFSTVKPEAIEDETSRHNRVWQVVPTTKTPRAPAWVIGTLVHEAIALWRFSDDNLDNWVKARASSMGLTDTRQLNHAVYEVERLLKQFQNWELFSEIEQADLRRHEVPYTYAEGFGEPVKTGYIDLLYRYNGLWTIVDFKTDRIDRKSAAGQLVEASGYRKQVERYGEAVVGLLGERPRLIICLLNSKEKAITWPVDQKD